MQKYFVPYFLHMVALSSIFERLVLLEAEARCPPSKRGRPRELSDSEALSVFFKVLRTGMQWREADGAVHYTTLLRRMHVWSKNHVFDAAYTRALKTYKRLCPTTHYCVDSSYVKNAFGRECVGKNHTDRGRKALKLSVVVDQHGILHGICCHPGNRPDVVAPAQGVLHRATFTLGVISLILNFASAFNCLVRMCNTCVWHPPAVRRSLQPWRAAGREGYRAHFFDSYVQIRIAVRSKCGGRQNPRRHN